MTEQKPPRPKSTARQAPHDEEVYGTLGALLGTLEVIATDDHHPLSPVQSERVRGALRLGNAMQAQVEALLTLADDELATRLTRASLAMRPMVEHAVRGALRGFERANVALVMPSGEWGTQRVQIDSSRVDRSVRALAEVLAQRVGDGGVIEVLLEQRGQHVMLTLRGRAGSGSDLKRGGLVVQGARRLFELHGGALDLDASGLTMIVLLPKSEAP
ncbi:MAG: hypothetical protein ABW352_10900 [Polyangiales bacterium]